MYKHLFFSLLFYLIVFCVFIPMLFYVIFNICYSYSNIQLILNTLGYIKYQHVVRRYVIDADVVVKKITLKVTDVKKRPD